MTAQVEATEVAIKPHDWGRADIHRTTPSDIKSNVFVVTGATRVALGPPFCMDCGVPFPPTELRCVPKEDPLEKAMADAFELFEQPIKAGKAAMATGARLTKRG